MYEIMYCALSDEYLVFDAFDHIVYRDEEITYCMEWIVEMGGIVIGFTGHECPHAGACVRA